MNQKNNNWFMFFFLFKNHLCWPFFLKKCVIKRTCIYHFFYISHYHHLHHHHHSFDQAQWSSLENLTKKKILNDYCLSESNLEQVFTIRLEKIKCQTSESSNEFKCRHTYTHTQNKFVLFSLNFSFICLSVWLMLISNVKFCFICLKSQKKNYFLWPQMLSFKQMNEWSTTKE